MDKELKSKITDYLWIERDWLIEDNEEEIHEQPVGCVNEDIKVWLFEAVASKVEDELLPYCEELYIEVVKIIPETPDDENYLFGVKFSLSGREFLCAIGYDEEMGHPHVGITSLECKGGRSENIRQFARYIFPGDNYMENNNWYVYRFLDYDDFYDGFACFLQEVMNSLPISR